MPSTLHFPAITRSFSHRIIYGYTSLKGSRTTASEIVLMDAYSRYFTYDADACICGIPQITLTGTVEDWQRIRERIEMFDVFGLEWWTARLRRILDEFVSAASVLQRTASASFAR